MRRSAAMLPSLLCIVSLRAAPLVPAAEPPTAGEWPQWRGPRRDGVSTETGLLKEWPEGGPKLAWKGIKLGGGYSTVAIAGGKLFTQGDREDGNYLIALGLADGKELWATQNGPIYPNSRGSGPRGTPTVDGELVYAISGSGRLICAESVTGKKRFEIDLLSEYKGRNPHWGFSESPLIEKDWVLATPGGKGATVVALDKRTGKTVWKHDGSDGAAYSSLMAADIAGVRQVIAFTAKGVIGMAAADGKLLWRNDRAANGTANVATPIVRGDQVFASSGYGAGCVLLKLTAADGGVQASEVYSNKNMKNHHASSVLVGDHLYGFSDNTFTCMEFLTGKVVYPPESNRRAELVKKGGLVYADGRLYCLSESGEMALVEADPAKLAVKSRFKAFEMKPDPGAHGKRRNTWSHPVVAGGRLYLRNQDELFAYDIKAGETKTASRP